MTYEKKRVTLLITFNELKLKENVRKNKIEWRGHALNRMLERKITRKHVKTALFNGKVIEEYPDDFPFPSCLILGYANTMPLHVVCSMNQDNIWIITAYKPSSEKWEDDFKTRKG